MTAPEPPRVQGCRTCWAITVDGEPATAPCECGDEARWEELVPLPLRVQTVDPERGWRNVYAERVLDRMAADAAYIRRLVDSDHGQAATATCEEFGHDARAGMCQRCGGRVARMDED